MTHGEGGGSKTGQKSVTYYLNGPVNKWTENDVKKFDPTQNLDCDMKQRKWTIVTLGFIFII